MRVNLIVVAAVFVVTENVWAQARVSEEQAACFRSGGTAWQAGNNPHCQCPTGKVNASSLLRGSVPDAGKDVCVDAEARNASRPDNVLAAPAAPPRVEPPAPPAPAARPAPARPARRAAPPPAEPTPPPAAPAPAPAPSPLAPATVSIEEICRGTGGTWRAEGNYPHCQCPEGMVHAGTADPSLRESIESQGEFCLHPEHPEAPNEGDTGNPDDTVVAEVEEEPDDEPEARVAREPPTADEDPGAAAADVNEFTDTVRTFVRAETRISLCDESGGAWNYEVERCDCPGGTDVVRGTTCRKGRWWHVGPEAGITGFGFDTRMPLAGTVGARASWRLRHAELVARLGLLFAGTEDHPAGSYVGAGLNWMPWQTWRLWTGTGLDFPGIDRHLDAALVHWRVFEIGPGFRSRGFRLDATMSLGAVFPDERFALGYGVRAAREF